MNVNKLIKQFIVKNPTVNKKELIELVEVSVGIGQIAGVREAGSIINGVEMEITIQEAMELETDI